MLLSRAPFMPVIWALSRLKFFLTYRPMLVLCYYRNTPPNFAFVGIILFGHRVRRPLKILAILPSITPMVTCTTSQVMLRTKPQVYLLFIIALRFDFSSKHAHDLFLIYFQSATCIYGKPRCGSGGLSPPVPAYLPSGLPFFHAEFPGIRLVRCIRLFLNSGPIKPRRRRKTLMS